MPFQVQLPDCCAGDMARLSEAIRASVSPDQNMGKLDTFVAAFAAMINAANDFAGVTLHVTVAGSLWSPGSPFLRIHAQAPRVPTPTP